MSRRLDLQKELEILLGINQVYFQPPATIKLSYPCIIYSIGIGNAKYANNKTYKYVNSYDVIYITKSPDLDMIEKILKEFQMCRLNRTYCSDNLYHYAFTIYY